MFISRTRDKKTILKVLKHPKVWPWISDDCSPENYTPLLQENVIYLTEESKMGIIRIDPMNGICGSVHISTRPELWGKTVEFAEAARAWTFKHTRYVKLVAMVPSYNRLALRLIKKLGFECEGTIKKSLLKNWELHDVILFGLNKAG